MPFLLHSPNLLPNRSEQPLMTFGESLKIRHPALTNASVYDEVDAVERNQVRRAWRKEVQVDESSTP